VIDGPPLPWAQRGGDSDDAETPRGCPAPVRTVRVLPLDVTDAESISEADRALFETNTFGAMAVTQAFLPQFRTRRAGVIANVSSSVTLRPLPMLAAYTASKAAMNAFSESLALELQAFSVRVRVVLPGRSPETAFGENAQAGMRERGVAIPEPYTELSRSGFEGMGRTTGPVTRSLDVAEAVWRAVNDQSCPFRLPAGEDAVEWALSNAHPDTAAGL